jgi:prepilin-type N-terminal cleavage/methylation domain-containing protein
MKKMNNKGLSLVELIIVIAIMAILIGILAPNLMRYIERTNVSADTQVLDGLRTAMITAMADPSNSAGHVATLSAALQTSQPVALSGALSSNTMDVNDDIAVTLQVSNTVYTPGTSTGVQIVAFLQEQFRSTPANASGDIYAMMQNGGNIVLWLYPSDATGARRTGGSGVASTTDVDIIVVGLFD